MSKFPFLATCIHRFFYFAYLVLGLSYYLCIRVAVCHNCSNLLINAPTHHLYHGERRQQNPWCKLCIATIGVNLGGQPGHMPPIIEKRRCIYHFFTTLPPNILVCPPNIFDKSAPVIATVGLCFGNEPFD